VHLFLRPYPVRLSADRLRAGVGPWIGLPIGAAAIVANLVSIRRFHRADHKWKWPMTAINVGIIGLLTVLVVLDGAELLG
jgi:hypothetical protein